MKFEALFVGILTLAFALPLNANAFFFGDGLCAVASRGEIEKVTAELIQKSGADAQVCALGYAKNVDTLNALLKDGVDINVRSTHYSNTGHNYISSKENALFDVIRWGRKEIFSALLEKGIDVNAQDARGETPLMIAAIGSKTEVVKALLDAGALPNLKDGDGYTALCFAHLQMPFFGDHEIDAMIENRGGVCEN